MKLTEAKLKQMILDEMKSNLSIADQDQLRADIELVVEITAQIDSLKKERIDKHPRTPDGTRLIGRHRPPELVEIDHLIAEKQRQIRAIAMKYNIPFEYTGTPGNYDLISVMKNKFRRKSL